MGQRQAGSVAAAAFGVAAGLLIGWAATAAALRDASPAATVAAHGARLASAVAAVGIDEPQRDALGGVEAHEYETARAAALAGVEAFNAIDAATRAPWRQPATYAAPILAAAFALIGAAASARRYAAGA